MDIQDETYAQEKYVHGLYEKLSSKKETWPEKQFPTRGKDSWFYAVYSAWTYSYMNPILRKGQRQFKDGDHLQMNDLYSVPEELTGEFLLSLFRQEYLKKKTLTQIMWTIAGPSFQVGALWELIHVATRISLPLSLRALLIVVEQSPPGVSIFRQTIWYSVTLTLASLVNCVAQNRSVYLSTKAGIAVRAALSGAIYDHAIRLSPQGRHGVTPGEISNLVAVDAQKLYDVFVEGQNVWSCPLLIVVVASLLWTLLGPGFVLGIVVMLLFLPIVKSIVSSMVNVRKERSSLTDVRINILTTMLQGVRVTKLNHYEAMVETAVHAVRKKEMALLRKELNLWGLVLLTAVATPLVAYSFAVSCHVLIKESNIIRPSDAFSALLLFSILRFPINLTARLVGKIAQATDAVNRITRFLEREVSVAPVNSHDANLPQSTVLKVEHGSFILDTNDMILNSGPRGDCDNNGSMEPHDQGSKVNEFVEKESQDDRTSFIVREVSLAVEKGQLILVVGKVGSGKSTLLRALLGDVARTENTRMDINGCISYASQEAFIMNASLRENVLFGSHYDPKRYERCLDACSLGSDIKRLGDLGDLTQIGERGVTLSGGQKQRVSLARAVYANPDLALLDDCFSALDANTMHTVFQCLFSVENNGMLRGGGTILITHALHLLPAADLILVMAEGRPIFLGTWDELQSFQTDNEESSTELMKAIVQDNKGESQRRRSHAVRRSEGTESDGIIMTVEEREYGISGVWVWIKWFNEAGGWSFFISQMLLLILDRALFLASDWWIAIWSGAATEGTSVFGFDLPPQSDGRSAQAVYVAIYNVIILLSNTTAWIRSLYAFTGSVRCTEGMFALLTGRTLRAPLSYFETTPLGRIINRFTYDVEVLDVELAVAMLGLMISASWLVSSVVVMVIILPWSVVALIPVCILYFFLQLFYRMTGPDLQRIDATSRSPVQAALAEGVEGSITIRAFKKEQSFIRSFLNLVDDNSAAMMNYLAAHRWLGLRIEFLGSIVTLACTLVVVCANDVLGIPANLVGLLIQWSVVFTVALNFFFLRLSETEARITSVERMQAAADLCQEASWETNASKINLEPSWPSKGELEFDNVSMRYRTGLPFALKSLSFKIQAGSRCGVVGRTGAGKTSIVACLFRIVEIEEGRIFLDNVDLSTIGLTDVRGRTNGMRVIPQDPVLYSGTLRDCLDPFQHCKNDAILLDALRAVNHRGVAERGIEVLDDKVEGGGSNFSVGERQLLCLARALVDEPRVLVLDEATASVDLESDALIQTMLRTRFKQTTMLTIAHRLQTIIDYDNILVLDEGKLAEFGSPRELLSNPHGIFTSMVDSTGGKTATELRNIAYASGA